MIKTRQYFFLLILCCLVSGCATQAGGAGKSTDIGSTDITEPDKPLYWWYARFRLVWPPDTEPDFFVDLLLADAVIKPVLHSYRQNIKYWRFHRRAIRDDAGHQFSFIFYTNKDTAGNIYRSILNDQIANQLKQENIVQDIVLDDLNNNLLADIKDTSDKTWSTEMQTAWPAYIMGVSNMWLQLIEQEIDVHHQTVDTGVLLEEYRMANQKINQLWQAEAQHALFHHLNAIFGYEPVIIKKAIQF
jgi:hypothetical protein